MDIDRDWFTTKEKEDWDELWMYNKIVCAIRKQRNVDD